MKTTITLDRDEFSSTTTAGGTFRIPGPRTLSRKIYRKVGKRAFDVFFSLALLPIILPVVAVLWVLSRRDGGPGFFGHTRIGQNGASFKCWKIRTMVPDAEAKLADYLATNLEAAKEWASDHKLTNDPRITAFGNFLRKTSLDELPQIFNVLKGEMSFVGPRPVVRDEMAHYSTFRHAYLAQKPGITGLWQVSGRNDVSYAERVQFDVTYLAQKSLWYDVRIILMTFTSVANKTGK